MKVKPKKTLVKPMFMKVKPLKTLAKPTFVAENIKKPQ